MSGQTETVAPLTDVGDAHVVAFIGVVGSGKDYRANELAGRGFTRVDFKDELVRMVSDLVGYDIRPEYDWFKHAPVGWRKPSNPMAEGIETGMFKGMPAMLTGRVVLQRMGTEVMRQRDPHYWVDAMARKASSELWSGGKIVTADCRFTNEVTTLQALHPTAKLIFCDYRSPRYDRMLVHKSEELAQQLYALGLEDGQEIKAEHFAAIKEVA